MNEFSFFTGDAEGGEGVGEEEGGMGLHHKYLRAMQSEALDDFYTDIKRHLWHLDYTLVRNFQVVIPRKTLFTMIALEWFLFFMN